MMMNTLRTTSQLNSLRRFHISATCQKTTVGRYKTTKNRSKLLTYEMANKPHHIAHRKGWNSWNTTSLLDGRREPETLVDDTFIRKFMIGTFQGMVLSEIIIKRQFNMIRIAFIVCSSITPVKMYFLIGYTEEFLSYWLKGPVKLELQVVKDKKDVAYKYV